MSEPAVIQTGSAAARTSGGLLEGWARKLILSRLRNLRYGALEIAEAGQTTNLGDASSPSALRSTLRIHDPGFWTSVAMGGSVGAGEAYMAGLWTCNDLTTLLRIMILNRQIADGMEKGLARLGALPRRLYHGLRRNTQSGSRRNIAAHYDLGNEFFALFLDAAMMYSCALFEREDMSLDEASIAKLDRICRKLALAPGDHLLEIGTGWGGLALYAARNYGCRVTTATISRKQHEFACGQVAAHGLADRITVVRSDYRDLRGTYDKLVSIEMVEAVGHQFFDAYFAACNRLLKPEGLMLLQAITIADQHYQAAVRSVDFIKRYIFPGSCIPSVTALCASITRASDLRLVHLEDLTPHYATTLKAWRQRFFDHLEQVRSLGFGEDFIRMWEFYLCYCEAGFRERYLGDVQMVFAKPLSRSQPILGRLPS
jgi:cyclopropane-fatty-acyl-phospholipid synthase